jgi:hypothetical protein
LCFSLPSLPPPVSLPPSVLQHLHVGCPPLTTYLPSVAPLLPIAPLTPVAPPLYSSLSILGSPHEPPPTTPLFLVSPPPALALPHEITRYYTYHPCPAPPLDSSLSSLYTLHDHRTICPLDRYGFTVVALVETMSYREVVVH